MALISSAVADYVEAEKRRRQLATSVISSPAVAEAMGMQQERRKQILASVAKSSALAFTGQQEMMRDRILEAARRSQVFTAFNEPSREWRDQILKNVDMSSLLGAHQHERLRQLIVSCMKSPAMEQAFQSWKLNLPLGFAEQMATYQAGLLANFASEVPADAAEGESGDAWFGAESWSRLVWEMVTILKCAELMTAGMVTAKYGMNAPIPGMALYLLGMFIAAGELAAHFAEDAFDGDD